MTPKEYKQMMDYLTRSAMAGGGRINFDGGGSPLQKFRQEIVESMKPYAPSDVTEDQLQLVVKDITLDMTAEQAQASALSNFRKLFGMADGGRIPFKKAGEVKDFSSLKNIRLSEGGKFRFDSEAGGKFFTKTFPADTDLKDVIKFRDNYLSGKGIEPGKIKKGPNPKRGKYVGVKDQKHIKFNGVNYQVAVQRMKDGKMVTEKPFYTTSLTEAKKVRDQRVSKSPPKIQKGVFNPDREKEKRKIDERRTIQKAKEGRTNIAYKAPKGYQVHHLLPLTLAGPDTNTRDLAVISAQMNQEIAQFDKPIKNLTEEAALLDYNGDRDNAFKRLKEINQELNDIVKKGVKKLGPKYKGLIGFNEIIPIPDENGQIFTLDFKPVGIDFKKSIAKNIKVPEKVKNLSTPALQKLAAEAPMFAANPMFSPGILKEAFKQLPTPAAAVGLNLLLGVDPTSAIDRASIAAEAAFAPQLVKQAAKLGTVGQKIANLGLSPAMAARAARIASPIGIASLGLEGLYQGGKFAKKRIAELKAMSPEERAELRRQGEAFAFDPFQAADGGRAGFMAGTIPGGYGKDANRYIKEIESDMHRGYQYYKRSGGKKKFQDYVKESMRKYFAGGGISKLAGVDSGPPPERGPLPQGLPGLLKRGMKI